MPFPFCHFIGHVEKCRSKAVEFDCIILQYLIILERVWHIEAWDDFTCRDKKKVRMKYFYQYFYGKKYKSTNKQKHKASPIFYS
jgi:hypothetical protein